MIRFLLQAWRRATYREPTRVYPVPGYTAPKAIFEAHPYAHWHTDPANCPDCRHGYGWRPQS